MPTYFVVNPAAGRGQSKQVWARLRTAMNGKSDWDWAFTQGPGHATELARQAIANGFERIAAVGGDGTLCQVAASLVQTDAALAIVPGGTGNDYCRSVGIPTDPVQAADRAVHGQIRTFDVGAVTLHDGTVKHFLNVAGIGFDAEVAEAVNAYPKYLGGTVPYLLGIMKTLWRYNPVELDIEADGRRLSRKSLMMAVAIARYYGGGMKIAPDADLHDGLFDLCIAGDLGRVETLGLVPKLYSGGHVGHPKVEFIRCKEVRVSAQVPVAAHTDGELIGKLPVTFRMLPGALRVVTGATS